MKLMLRKLLKPAAIGAARDSRESGETNPAGLDGQTALTAEKRVQLVGIDCKTISLWQVHDQTDSTFKADGKLPLRFLLEIELPDEVKKCA
jgi:hypothetical protein